MIASIGDFVVDMGSDGPILSQGFLDNVLKHDSHLVKEDIEEREELEKVKREVDVEKQEHTVAKQTAGKLTHWPPQYDKVSMVDHAESALRG
ncbi:hypothetical protein TRAPUB_5625 [Trametes pubescens]|uniref:Uncharacterized protein n=1 Tax=Trametes pubescens TaxID=154538 RepID=A0A1M2V7Z5_TRAPU|nr:hypothetical protein TRAPUB_5625 [Trametes pubescens]